MSDLDNIEQGYRQTHFEMVATGAGDKYEVPVSEPAGYELAKQPDPAAVEGALSDNGYSLIAPHAERGYLSSKIYDSETNEFFHIKLTEGLLRVFPKDEQFSLETFRRFVEIFNKHVCGLELVAEDE